MLGSWLFPLAPAAGLLLSAFLLFGVVPLLPAAWRTRWGVGAPVLVGLGLLAVLFVPVSTRSDDFGQGLDLLSGWNFSTTASVAALTVRADLLSLPFLLVMFLVLLAITLIGVDIQQVSAPKILPVRVLGWLLMGVAATVLFVAANGLTVLYAVVAFDVISAAYWISKGQRDVGVGRLFLGVFTGLALVLATLVRPNEWAIDQLVLGAVLWLRLGLFPMAEFSVNKSWQDDERLAYLALSLGVGLYLVARLVQQPLPTLVLWLVAATMVLGGQSTWLTGKFSRDSATATPAQLREKRVQVVTWMGLTLALLPLLAAPLSLPAATAFVVGLTLSLVALWVTPALGYPKFSEGAWSWPYLPAVMATATLVGVPLSLGWYFRGASYQSMLRVDSIVMLLVVALAEALALSGLVFYWRWLVQSQEHSFRRSAVTILAMVPFLTPGLGPFILFSFINPQQPFFEFELSGNSVTVLVGVVVLAVVLGHFRPQLQARLRLSSGPINERLFGGHLINWIGTAFFVISKSILRVQLVLEGQHYIGWALLAALVGMIIILLS